ncbi:YidC/Oxa1 family membrane protein insertase [Candidatus Gottesmanbacteria bacterium]|nr:YidC/Oxa1 family membrane protein insertase [Candidatus Gottesmanbacteria bacterium]
MISVISGFLTHVVYQPFFNLLVVIYYFLQKIDVNADMGMAVILFTIAFRIIILPLSLSTGRTEEEKLDMMTKYSDLEKKFQNNELKLKKETKNLFRSNKRILIAEIFDVGIQVLIAIMLYRIFSTGLEGADFHLLYRGVSIPSKPFNLTFLGIYDLSRPNMFLNTINTIIIFIAEATNIVNSQRPITRDDKMALFVFPLLAFIFFAYMPAGKKLFVITTLAFSICLMLVQQGIFWYHKITGKLSVAFYSKVKKEEDILRTK